jgi:hypothetical protein
VAALNTGSRGSPRACPPPPLPFGILILIAKSLTLRPKLFRRLCRSKGLMVTAHPEGAYLYNLPPDHCWSLNPDCYSGHRDEFALPHFAAQQLHAERRDASIVPPLTETKRDPRYMRVSNLSISISPTARRSPSRILEL